MGAVEIAALISTAVVVVNLIVTFADRIERSNKFKAAINKALSDVRIETGEQIAELKDNIVREMKAEYATMADAMPAIREKINQVELWARDEFIRREDFYRTVDTINKNIGELGIELKNRFDKIDKKIDDIKRN